LGKLVSGLGFNVVEAFQSERAPILVVVDRESRT